MRLIHVLTITLLCAPATAQKPQPPTEKPDARKPDAKTLREARELLKSWEEKRYHMGRAGVRRLRCKLKVVSRGGMTGKWTATGSYEFGTDPKQPDGRLRWDDEEVAQAMTRRGWTAEVFARELRLDALQQRLKGKELDMQKSPRGSVVTLTDLEGSRGLIFDRQGLLLAEVVDPLRKRIHFEVRQGKYCRVGEEYEMPDTAGRVRVHWTEREGRLLLAGFDERVLIRGRLHSDMSLRLHGFELSFELPKKPAKNSAKNPAKKPAKEAAKK